MKQRPEVVVFSRCLSRRVQRVDHLQHATEAGLERRKLRQALLDQVREPQQPQRVAYR